MRIHTIYASSVAKLDSDVHRGGGTDDTEALQAVLDLARDEDAGVRLVMDGAALVRGLEVHSNTVIECLTKDCGFFQKPQSNRSLLCNRQWSTGQRLTKHIRLIGGTYNQNCRNQGRLDCDPDPERQAFIRDLWKNCAEKDVCGIYALLFYGVEDLCIRDVELCNFRTWAAFICNFRNVYIENVWCSLPDKMRAENQDGLHFGGPGQFLTVRNCGGNVGDDFMNLGPDELVEGASITDAIVDGIHLEHADQAIRLLSRGSGRLDRITIRNISGTYRSYGFYINPWFSGRLIRSGGLGTYGSFGNIFIENVDLRPEDQVYDYRRNFLFSIGGNIERIELRNIRHHGQTDGGRTLIELGAPFFDPEIQLPPDHLPHLHEVVIDGLSAYANDASSQDQRYIDVLGPVHRLVLRNVSIEHAERAATGNSLIHIDGQGRVDELKLHEIDLRGIGPIADRPERIRRATGQPLAE